MFMSRLLYMTTVEEIKEMMTESSKTFGSAVGDSRLFEAKLWYLTGIVNGILRATGEYLNPEELQEVLAHKHALLEEN